MSKRGFTLVELLITIAIIGILASLVLPRLFGPTEQGRSSEARNMLGSIRQLEESYHNGPAGAYLAINTNPPACDDLAATALWLQLGIETPNANPNSYFTYCIGDFATDPPQILITATRTAVSASAGDIGKVMCLNQAGTWSGDYSQTPQNPGGGTCGGGSQGDPAGPCC